MLHVGDGCVCHLTAVCGDGTAQWHGLLDIMEI